MTSLFEQLLFNQTPQDAEKLALSEGQTPAPQDWVRNIQLDLQVAQQRAGSRPPDAAPGLTREQIEASFRSQGMTAPPADQLSYLRDENGRVIGVGSGPQGIYPSSPRVGPIPQAPPLSLREQNQSALVGRRELDATLAYLLRQGVETGVISQEREAAIRAIWFGGPAPFQFSEKVGRPDNLFDEDVRADLRQAAAPFRPGQRFSIDNDTIMQLAFAVTPLLDELDYLESLILPSLTVFPCHEDDMDCFLGQSEGELCAHQTAEMGRVLASQLKRRPDQFPRQLHPDCIDCTDTAWGAWEVNGRLPKPPDTSLSSLSGWVAMPSDLRPQALPIRWDEGLPAPQVSWNSPEPDPITRRVTATVRGQLALDWIRAVYGMDLNEVMGRPDGTTRADVWRDDDPGERLSPRGLPLRKVYAEREDAGSSSWWVRYEEEIPQSTVAEPGS